MSSLVYIAGLGHSGSTLLDLLLSSQPGITGLGEIDVLINPQKRETYLKKFQKYPCTCGKLPAECPVWSTFREVLHNGEVRSFDQAYRKVLEITRNVTGAQMISDSSKRLTTLKKVYHSLDEIGIERDQFRVIHLVKDVRNFTASMLRDKKMTFTIRQAFRHWKTSNREIDTYLNTHQIPHITVGYEELALSTEFTMNRIAGFLGLNPDRIVIQLNGKNGHIAFGNQMRISQSDKIWYDYRWFSEPGIQLRYGLSLNIQQLNSKWVYGNVDKQLNQKGRFQAPK